MNELKQKLLGLGVFVDNEYLDLYCSLIESKAEPKRIKYRTQLHHVIPRCFYESKELADKDPENLKVHLRYEDHILAHYYLVPCISDSVLQAKLFLAVKRLLGYNGGGKGLTLDEKQFRTSFKVSKEYQQLYEQTKRAVAQLSCVYLNRPVICVETQEVFSDIYEASECKKGISFIERACTGQYTTAGKFHWCWLDDKERQAQLKQYIGKKPKSGYRGHNNIRVICIETGKEYESTLAAKQDTGAPKILECIYQIRNQSGGLHWAKVGDTERIRELEQLIAGKISSSTITTKKSKESSANTVFYKWTDEEVEILLAQYSSKGADIPELLVKHPRNTIRQKAHKLGLSYDYKSNTRTVRCIETNQEFSSPADAAKFFNTTTNSMYCALNAGRKAGGYHWEYV